MYCSSCGAFAGEGASHCQWCGKALAVQTTSSSHSIPRPIAGIIVAIVFGTLGLIWSGVSIFQAFYDTPSGIQAELFQIFPGLQVSGSLFNSLSFCGCTVVIIGALLSYAGHYQGNRTVRVACLSMLGLIVIGVFVTLLIMMESSSWPYIEAETKSAIIGGLIGGSIGGSIQWGLILFLFRKRKIN